METLKRPWRWLDNRTNIGELIASQAKHPVPPETTSGRSEWLYIFGVLTLVAFLNQVITGIMLGANYIPSTAHAYASLQFITNETPFGGILRGMHFWGASAMVVFAILHLVRVFLTGSYKFPREVSWLTGVVLLGLTLAMAYTGQLLRWDENGVWSVAVATYFVGRVPLIGDELARFVLAGERVGGATLSRFFAFHVFIFPALLFMFVGAHLALVLHNGISELPRRDQSVEPSTYRQRYQQLLRRRGRPYWPDAAWNEVLTGGLLILAIVLLALLVGPPELGRPPDPTALSADPRPDWYFLWYYALLAVKPHGFEDLFLVYLPLAVGLIMLILPFVGGRGQRHPVNRPWSIAIVAVAGGLFTWLTVIGLRAPWVPDFDAGPLPVEVVGVTSGPVAEGARLFSAKGCLACHTVAGYGGDYGPELTTVGDRLGPELLTAITLRGRDYMPGYARILTPEEVEALVAFMTSLRTEPIRPPLSEPNPLDEP